ncbi:unnamed protein product [Adineta ricciae]|uniref:Uncharacterized protein n=1 Tax=Adineta ricciae TaxID=249248 RepID=A0A815KB66_ADIRI|nr:unnamed protein product [Adineta ricciae]
MANTLGLSYIQLKNCKKSRITATCRQVIKEIYSSNEQRAMERISTMCPNRLQAIRSFARLAHPKAKKTSTYILNNAIGNVFAHARL